MEIKTYAQLVRDAFDDDDVLTDYFIYNRGKKFVSVDSLIKVLSKLKSEAYIELLKELRK